MWPCSFPSFLSICPACIPEASRKGTFLPEQRNAPFHLLFPYIKYTVWLKTSYWLSLQCHWLCYRFWGALRWLNPFQSARLGLNAHIFAAGSVLFNPLYSQPQLPWQLFNLGLTVVSAANPGVLVPFHCTLVCSMNRSMELVSACQVLFFPARFFLTVSIYFWIKKQSFSWTRAAWVSRPH